MAWVKGGFLRVAHLFARRIADRPHTGSRAPVIGVWGTAAVHDPVDAILPTREMLMRPILLLGLFGSTASAADVLQIDLFDTALNQVLVYSSPTVPVTEIDLKPHIPSNLRAAFSQADPLELPCDVTFLAGGLSWRNISAQPVYVEMSGSLFMYGAEKVRLANVFGSVEEHAPQNIETAAGAIGTGGYIFLAEPPLYNFSVDESLVDITLAYLQVPGYDQPGTNAFVQSAPGYIPANVPLRIWYRIRAFDDNNYDHTRHGYSLDDLVPDSVVWDDCYTIWIERSCPAE